jgi:zinc/manganese transport system substrate-binding protein
MKLLGWHVFAVLATGTLCAAPVPLRVVTLSTVLTELAQEVGGDRVVVTGLVQPGVDPHTFSPSPRDIALMVDADVVLASGLNLEAYLDRLVANDIPKGRVVAVGDLLPGLPLFPQESRPLEKDPHWWNSVDNVIRAAEIVRARFTRISPGDSAAFALNASSYEERLKGLQEWAQREIEKLPAGRRSLVTSHDAFSYFARDYGFRLFALNGVSTDGEADGRRVARLVDHIRSAHIPAIFVEASANPRLVENLVQETGVKVGGVLYADGLGPPGSGAQTYDAMFRHNVTTIVQALLPQ